MNASLTPPPAATARSALIQLNFKEKGPLFAAYMPFIQHGGMFVPTTKGYKLGEEVYLLVQLPDDTLRYPIQGKVVWITPPNASGGRSQGVGVRFPDDDKSRLFRIKIEDILGTSISAPKPTQTL